MADGDDNGERTRTSAPARKPIPAKDVPGVIDVAKLEPLRADSREWCLAYVIWSEAVRYTRANDKANEISEHELDMLTPLPLEHVRAIAAKLVAMGVWGHKRSRFFLRDPAQHQSKASQISARKQRAYRAEQRKRREIAMHAYFAAEAAVAIPGAAARLDAKA